MARVRAGRFPAAEAQLAKLALAQQDIEAELSGEQRSVLQGVAPASETEVELWVDDSQVDRARRLISAQFAENASAAGSEVRCAACSNLNPGNFDTCWSCGASLEAASKVAEPEAERSRSRPSLLNIALILTTLGLAVLLWNEHRTRGPGSAAWKWDVKGQCAETFEGTLRVQRVCDRNHDGNYEQVDQFDSSGRLMASAWDSNEDGKVELQQGYDISGRLVSREADTDGDFRFDQFDAFDVNEKLANRSLDLDRDGRLDRYERWSDGGVVDTSPIE